MTPVAEQEVADAQQEIADVRREVAAKAAEIMDVEQQLQNASRDRVILLQLQQQLPALRQELSALQQKELLLVQQQSAGAGLQATFGGVTVQDFIARTAQTAAQEAAVAIALQTAQQLERLTEAIRRVKDEVRSVNSSQSVAASKISAPQLSMARQLLRIYRFPFDQTDPSVVLHDDAGDADYEWWLAHISNRDNAPEPSQREAYMAALRENLGSDLFNKLAWKTQVKVDILLYGLGHQLTSEADELLVAKHWEVMPDVGCVIGMDLKKNLTQASRRQGEAEFMAFSLSSNFPFMQLVTDMQRGAFAYYKQCDKDGQQVVVERVLHGMGTFHDFLKAALSDLPSVLTNAHTPPDVVQQLNHPERVKLYEPKLQGHASVFDDGADCGDDALHELGDWFPNKQQLEATGELPDALDLSDRVAAVQ